MLHLFGLKRKKNHYLHKVLTKNKSSTALFIKTEYHIEKREVPSALED